jgi:hypothetical protein
MLHLPPFTGTGAIGLPSRSMRTHLSSPLSATVAHSQTGHCYGQQSLSQLSGSRGESGRLGAHFDLDGASRSAPAGRSEYGRATGVVAAAKPTAARACRIETSEIQTTALYIVIHNICIAVLFRTQFRSVPCHPERADGSFAFDVWAPVSLLPIVTSAADGPFLVPHQR